MIRRPLLLLLFIGFIGGCAAPMTKASKSEYLAGAAPANVKADTIRDDIKRGGADKDPQNPFATGTVYVEAWPYTQAFTEAQVRDAAIKNADSAEETEKQMREQKKVFFDKRSCFMLAIRSREIEHAAFKVWRAKLKTGGKTEELELMNINGVESVPSAESYVSYNFLNTSAACLKGKINFDSEFELVMIPQYAGGSPVTLRWTKVTSK